MRQTHLKAVDIESDASTTQSWASQDHGLHRNRSIQIGMLNNPLSGGNRSGLLKIRQAAAKNPRVFQREVQTPNDVASALADFARREVNVLLVNGGDGTVQAVLTAIFYQKLFETMPLLAVLRSAGTTSMIAGDIGLKGSRKGALQRLFTWAQTKNVHTTVSQRPVLRVQVPAHKEPIYGMFLGAAGVYQAIHYCRQKIHTIGLRGELGPGLALMRFLLAIIFRDSKVVSSVPIITRLDQNPPEQGRYLLVLITTLQRLFLGLRPYWGRQPKPLHYTAIGSRPHRLLQAAPHLIRGRTGRCVTPANGYISHNVNEVQLTFDDGFTLDGELFTPDSQLGPVTVTNGGRASFLQL